ncbi:MAG: AraC family transcriptional regulator [Cyclobacteriaceae bacterium]|nr:MAG: AraC family transcriptional regulator [Cyclobacteriaceae bacterium]
MGSNLYIYKRIVQSKLFIDAHFSEAIDLDNIADEAYFSKFHFIRLFKSIYGKTPHQYLISVRVAHACLLLQQGMSVTETCSGVGFESLTSFTALFKKYVRLSPSEYQRICLAREEQIRTAPLDFIPACFATRYGWN